MCNRFKNSRSTSLQAHGLSQGEVQTRSEGKKKMYKKQGMLVI